MTKYSKDREKMGAGFGRGVIISAICACMVITGCSAMRGANTGPRNIIFMVPDGMGLADMTAARIYKNGLSGAPLSMETLPYIGYQRTYSENSTITDSAAAASAWAIGEKVRNNEISCHDADNDGVCDSTAPKTVLELAKDKGMSAGLVATSTITHATPAVWGAHVHTRHCESQIFRQYVENSQVDILLGGGIGKNIAGKKCVPDTTDAAYIADILIGDAEKSGYDHVTSKSDLEKTGKHGKVLGLFSEKGITEGMTPEYLKTADSGEPSLAEMTRAALRLLGKNPKGFFLMVEGSQIDWANHANNTVYQIGETLAFDAAVRVVLDWLDAGPGRQKNTLLIIAADHETGGFAINGPLGRLSLPGDTQSGPDINAGWTSRNHTGTDTLILSNSPLLAKPVDNTYPNTVMKDFLK